MSLQYIIFISKLFLRVTGGELFDDIVKRVKYTEADASKIIHKILEAVSYLHEKKIAHRDLKVTRILIVNSVV